MSYPHFYHRDHFLGKCHKRFQIAPALGRRSSNDLIPCFFNNTSRDVVLHFLYICRHSDKCLRRIQMSDKPEYIASLNDSFRAALLIGLAGGEVDGKYHITRGMQAAFGPNDMMQIFQEVANFDQFTSENDPYGEHDFGSLEYGGKNIFWKIDYYDKASLELGEEYGSEDPSNTEITTRVMTIMLSQEY